MSLEKLKPEEESGKWVCKSPGHRKSLANGFGKAQARGRVWHMGLEKLRPKKECGKWAWKSSCRSLHILEKMCKQGSYEVCAWASAFVGNY